MTAHRTTEEIHADYCGRRVVLRDRLHRVIQVLEAAENSVPEASAPEFDSLIDVLGAFDTAYQLGVEFGAAKGAQSAIAEMEMHWRSSRP